MTGTELREARERVGLTRTQLARKMMATYLAIYRYETGSRPISNMAAELARRIIEEMERAR